MVINSGFSLDPKSNASAEPTRPEDGVAKDPTSLGLNEGGEAGLGEAGPQTEAGVPAVEQITGLVPGLNESGNFGLGTDVSPLGSVEQASPPIEVVVDKRPTKPVSIEPAQPNPKPTTGTGLYQHAAGVEEQFHASAASTTPAR